MTRFARDWPTYGFPAIFVAIVLMAVSRPAIVTHAMIGLVGAMMLSWGTLIALNFHGAASRSRLGEGTGFAGRLLKRPMGAIVAIMGIPLIVIFIRVLVT